MDSGYYAACAGLVARTEALDTIANNLANTSTAGFRGSHNVFRSMLENSEGHNLSVLNQDANDYGVLSGTQLDTTQGALQTTNNQMDFAIEGSGYFQVKTSNGPEYTRGGSFRLSAQGQLVTASGDAVLNQSGTPITIPANSFSVSADGTITANGAVVDRLNIVEFAPGASIKSLGQGYYSIPGKPSTQPVSSHIRQGMLESSNVNPITSVIEMISAQREVESMRHALSMFDGEIDKTATQDLPRVG